MNLVDFLKEKKEKVLEKIRNFGDNPSEFYSIVQEQDAYGCNENGARKVTLGSRVCAAEFEGKHEIYLNVWSKNTLDITLIKETIKTRGWKEKDKKYISPDNTPDYQLSFEFKPNGDTRLILSQNQAFTKENYCRQVEAFIDWLVSLLNKT